MGHDVFLSYSSKDKSVADTIVASLEQNDIRCWYAPRDIQPSQEWGGVIAKSILESKLFLIIFSENSNHSKQVQAEVNLAFSEEIIILPFRIENLEPEGSLCLHLATNHWLDAYNPSWETYIQKLVRTVSSILDIRLEKDKKSEVFEEIRGEKDKKKFSTRKEYLQNLLIGIAIGGVLLTMGWLGFSIWSNKRETNPENARSFIATKTVLSTFDSASEQDIAPTLNMITEEFDSITGFTFTDSDIYIQNGQIQWTIHNDEGTQYIYREIPSFGGAVQLTVVGQINEASNNCYVRAGIGKGLNFNEGIGIDFGYVGGGCPISGYRIHAGGVLMDMESDGCSPINSLWVEPRTQYTGTLTISSDNVTLNVNDVGSLKGVPDYKDEYNLLFVGFPGGGDWPECSGSIERIIVEPFAEDY